MTKLAILYEDSRAASSRGYPLHTLVCACLADALGQPIGDIESISRAIPKGGDSKLLAACRNEVPNMREPIIVALFDADKLHRLLSLPGDTPQSKLHETLDANIGSDRVATYLLDRSTKTLVDATADCLARERPAKDQLARDKLLASAAWGERAQRDCIRDRVASFAHFIEQLAERVASLPA